MKMITKVLSGLGTGLLLLSSLSAFGAWNSSTDAAGHTVYTYVGSITDNGFTFSDINVFRFETPMSAEGLNVVASNNGGTEFLTFTGDFTGNANTAGGVAQPGVPQNPYWTDYAIWYKVTNPAGIGSLGQTYNVRVLSGPGGEAWVT